MELSYDPAEAVARLSRADRMLARVIKQAPVTAAVLCGNWLRQKYPGC